MYHFYKADQKAPGDLLLKFFLLVFECLLDLIHEPALLKQASSRTHAVQLERRWQLDLLVLDHLESR